MPRPGRWAQLLVNNFKMLIGIRTSQRNNNILTSAQCLAANPGYSIIEVSASMLNCSLIKCNVLYLSGAQTSPVAECAECGRLTSLL